MAGLPIVASGFLTVRRGCRPLCLTIAGVGANLLAIVVRAWPDETSVLVRVALILTGCTLAFIGVCHRLRHFHECIGERCKSVVCLVMASCAMLLASLAAGAEWDSGRLVLRVVACVLVAGTLLVALPLLARRAAILVLVVFHFGGIVTVILAFPPPTGSGFWLAQVLWTYFYRPYVQFVGLNETYPFFAPEPAVAPCQLWFRVSYADPALPARWVRIPHRADTPDTLMCRRHDEMVQYTTWTRGDYPADFYADDGPLNRRMRQSEKIPYHPDWPVDRWTKMPGSQQYRQPDALCKRYIASYARHVAHDGAYLNPEWPDVAVKTVRVYRVAHRLRTPGEIAEGMSLEEPTKFLPVYMGEFDADGQLLDPDDPLLYWVVPIIRESGPDGEEVVKDYVAVHAGDSPLSCGK
jgi:hypothetical protein